MRQTHLCSKTLRRRGRWSLLAWFLLVIALFLFTKLHIASSPLCGVLHSTNDRTTQPTTEAEYASDFIHERADIGSKLMLLPRGDGLGTHILAVLSCLAYCHAKNLTYVHMPWNHVGHAPPAVSYEKWSEDLERFTGLADGELRFHKKMEPVPAVTWIDAARDSDMYFTNTFLGKMRSKYFSSMYTRTHSEAFADSHSTFRVAVHIRRGDVEDGHESRFTKNSDISVFVGFVERYLLADPTVNKLLSFHIYSEGKEEDFRELMVVLGERQVHLHLDEDIKTTFHDIVSADALVMAKSAFTYSAALLSTGVVFYEPFWINPLKTWIVLPELSG